MGKILGNSRDVALQNHTKQKRLNQANIATSGRHGSIKIVPVLMILDYFSFEIVLG